MILAMPAPGGFDLLARHVLGPAANDIVVAGTVCLPWACRIQRYAHAVELLGEKTPVMLVARPASGAARVIEVANQVHDRTRFEAATLFTQATLFPTNPILHPVSTLHPLFFPTLLERCGLYQLVPTCVARAGYHVVQVARLGRYPAGRKAGVLPGRG